MTIEDALRFVAHEAAWCRSREETEALCLLFPVLLRTLRLEPMNGYEADAFRAALKEWLSAERDRTLAEQERTRI